MPGHRIRFSTCKHRSTADGLSIWFPPIITVVLTVANCIVNKICVCGCLCGLWECPVHPSLKKIKNKIPKLSSNSVGPCSLPGRKAISHMIKNLWARFILFISISAPSLILLLFCKSQMFKMHLFFSKHYLSVSEFMLFITVVFLVYFFGIFGMENGDNWKHVRFSSTATSNKITILHQTTIVLPKFYLFLFGLSPILQCGYPRVLHISHIRHPKTERARRPTVPCLYRKRISLRAEQ